MSNILVFCESADGKAKSSARELLGKAKELAGGGTVTAVLMGATADGSGLGDWGADKVLTVAHDALGSYVPGAYADALAAVVRSVSPDVVLASASGLGKDLLPRAAALVEAGVGADVVDLREGANGIEGVRPLYAGKCLAVVNVNSTPKFFSVRPNSFTLGGVAAGAGAVESFNVSLDGDYGYTVVGVTKTGGDKPDLTEADAIVAGGRSLKSAENFGVFDEISDLLGAAVGASRAAVDAGYAPHGMQIGQTGKTVNPSLYIACGISGAIQHLAGMRTSRVIVAINKDADAPIFQHSTYGIVADLFEAVPMLTAELKGFLAD